MAWQALHYQSHGKRRNQRSATTGGTSSSAQAPTATLQDDQPVTPPCSSYQVQDEWKPYLELGVPPPTPQELQLRARQKRQAEFGKLPNNEIGKELPLLSTAFHSLPLPTGFHFESNHFFICRRSTDLKDDPRVQPHHAETPDWSEFQGLNVIADRGYTGFSECLSNSVFPAVPARWAHYTNLDIPAYIYQREGKPVGAVFFAQDHQSGCTGVAFSEIVIVQLAVSLIELQ